MNRTILILALAALASLASCVGRGRNQQAEQTAGKKHNGMDKPNETRPDSIAFPLLWREDKTGQTYIDGISKYEWPFGSELFYEDQSSRGITIVGADDIFLHYEIRAILIDPDRKEFFFNSCHYVLRFVPQEDGSFEISSNLLSASFGYNGDEGHADPSGRWQPHGNSTLPTNDLYMTILDLYNTYVATGKVKR